METVVKIFDKAYNIKQQFINVNNLEYEEDIEGYGEMQFTLPLGEIADFLEYDRVVLSKIEDGEDKYIWDGYIREINTDLNSARIICADLKKYLKKKIIFQDKSYSGATVDSVLNELFDESFTRSGDKLWYKTNIGDETISEDFTKGAKYFDIINDMAELLGAEWVCRLGVVYFYDDIGGETGLYAAQNISPVWNAVDDVWDSINDTWFDYSTGISAVLNGSIIDIDSPQYVEFRYNYRSPAENSIIGININRNADDVYTSIIGDNGNVTSEQTNNTDVFGHIEKKESFTGLADSEVERKTSKKVENESKPHREYEIDVDTRQYDLRDLMIGYNARVVIESQHEFINIDDFFNITKKRVQFINKKPIVNITLAKKKVSIKNIGQVFDRIEKRLHEL